MVLLLADDMGMGDISLNNENGKIKGRIIFYIAVDLDFSARNLNHNFFDPLSTYVFIKNFISNSQTAVTCS